MKNFIKMVALLSAIPATAFSDISVNPMNLIIDTTTHQVNAKSFSVQNDSTKKAYISVQLLRVEHPGTPQETEIPYQYKSSASLEKFGMTLNPRKFILDPGAAQNVQLLSFVHPKDKDAVYRAVVSTYNNLEAVSQHEKNTISAGVNLNMSYGVTIVVSPQHPVIKMNVKRVGNNIIFKNEGNTYTSIFSGDCSGVKNDALRKKINGQLSIQRIYAKTTYTEALPKGCLGPITYQFSKHGHPYKSISIV